MLTIDIQISAREQLKEYLNDYDIIQFVGPVGSGRMHTLKSLRGEYHVLEISEPSRDESLQTINNSLFAYHNILSTYELSNNISIGICSAFSIGLSFKKHSPIEEEKTLLKRLKKLSQPIPIFGRVTPVIIAIRHEACNERIVNFLNLAIHSLNAQRNRIKIIYLSETINQTANVQCVYMPLLNNSQMNFRQILLALKLNPNILGQLTNEEVSFIFNICLNNFTDLTTIVRALNEHTVSFKDQYDNEDYLYDIIIKNLNRRGLTKGKDIITFCSHASKEATNITECDLEYLIGVNQNELNHDLEGTQQLNIIRQQDRYIKIMVELVKKIAINKSSDNQYAIYKRFSEMLSYMYPSDYATKYKFILNVDKKQGEITKTQYILQQIRLRHPKCDSQDLPLYLQEFITNYTAAINFCINKNYAQAISQLDSYLNDVELVIRAEATLIIAQALMKSLDDAQRTYALNLLNAINISGCDGNLRYRILMCRMSAYVHKGKYNDAINDYNTLLIELKDKILLYPSEELNYYLHLLLRKTNMIYNFQAAQGSIRLAKEFFKQRENDFTNYFYALCNSLCSNIENMSISKAKEDIEDFDKLQFDHSDITFKRQYIFDNNRILYNYFFENQTAEVTADKFYKLFNSMSNYADRYLIANNYAVFLALSGRVNDALLFLENNASQNIFDEEGVYEYRTKINSSIMKFILDNNKRNHLIEEISRLSIDRDQPNKVFKEKEIKAICKTMSSFDCSTAEEWQIKFKSLMSQNRPLNIYEQGFVITPLSNWDDD